MKKTKRETKKRTRPPGAGRPKGVKYSSIQKNMTRGDFKIVHECRSCESVAIEYGNSYTRRYCANCNLEMRAKATKVEETAND